MGDDWRKASWAGIRRQVDRVAQGLLDRRLGDTRIMILSGASTEHLIVMLAGLTVGAPVVSASVAYSLQDASHAKLKAMVEVAEPGLIFAQNADFAPALAAIGAGRTTVTAQGDVEGTLTLEELAADPTTAVDEHLAAVSAD